MVSQTDTIDLRTINDVTQLKLLQLDEFKKIEYLRNELAVAQNNIQIIETRIQHVEQLQEQEKKKKG